jgi:hypothetical protein
LINTLTMTSSISDSRNTLIPPLKTCRCKIYHSEVTKSLNTSIMTNVIRVGLESCYTINNSLLARTTQFISPNEVPYANFYHSNSSSWIHYELNQLIINEHDTHKFDIRRGRSLLLKKILEQKYLTSSL